MVFKKRPLNELYEKNNFLGIFFVSIHIPSVVLEMLPPIFQTKC